LSADEVAAVIDEVAERFSIRAASLTAYNPAVDPEGRIPPIAVRLVAQIVKAGAAAETSLA
jgi:arginase family enzyme